MSCQLQQGSVTGRDAALPLHFRPLSLRQRNPLDFLSSSNQDWVSEVLDQSLAQASLWPLSSFYILCPALLKGGIHILHSGECVNSVDKTALQFILFYFLLLHALRMREIVHIQAGQCGNQIGAKVRILKTKTNNV